MQPQLKCPVCQGARITPPTHVQTDRNAPYLLYQKEGGGFFDSGVTLEWIGSACLDCGHVLFFLSPAALHLARQQRTFVPWVAK